MGKNDAKTPRKEAIFFFENGEKKLRFQTNTDTYSILYFRIPDNTLFLPPKL